MGLNITGVTKESPLDEDIPFRSVAPGATRLWEQKDSSSLRKGCKPRHHFIGAKRFLGEGDDLHLVKSS